MESANDNLGVETFEKRKRGLAEPEEKREGFGKVLN